MKLIHPFGVSAKTDRRLRHLPKALILGLLLVTAAAPAWADGGIWQPQGPSPLQFGQAENVFPNDEVTGAVHTVAPHPTDANILYVGSVNGGVWKTTNATDPQPSWAQLTDSEAALAIGALEFDPIDTTHETLVAGIGLFSSYGRIGGARTGLLRSTNRGNSWTALDGGGALIDKNISGVAPRGKTIVVSINFSVPFTFGRIGIWRSTDRGVTFAPVSLGNGAATGLPDGITYDLVGDPNNDQVLYTSVVFADFVGGQNGLYRSTNTGATWTKISDPAIDALLISGTTSNVELAVGEHGNVYAAIANSGSLAGLFRSGDNGSTWAALDLPQTVEDGVPVGIHPGGQGSIHLSITADPTDANIVYIGGDRQPFEGEFSGGAGFFPNSIGADDFSGRLFRVDASAAPGSQAVHLTHSSTLGAAGGGTASSSSPHADSRELKFDAAGDLIETDDGGIYRRTSPRDNTGDWLSINGDLQVNEQHNSALDTNSQTAFSGNQDTGTGMQNAPGTPEWFTWIGGDGGDVAVDNVTLAGAGESIRYTSAQGFQAFNRSFWDAANGNLGFAFPSLTVLDGGAPFTAQFTTPLELNTIDPTRLVIGGGNSVYESLDLGDTIREVGPGIVVNAFGENAIAYGGAGNPDLLVVGDADQLFIRTAAHPAPLAVSATFPGAGAGFFIRDIVIDPDDADRIVVITSVAVFLSTDQGASWADITGDIFTEGAQAPLRSLEYMPEARGSEDVIAVGSSNGVYFAAETPSLADWLEFGEGMPEVLVTDLDFDRATGVLNAGTIGRGNWSLTAFEGDIIDDFEDGVIDPAWTLVGIGNANQESAAETGGVLQLTADGATAFYGPDNAGFLYRSVEGEFRMEVTVDGNPMTTGGPFRKAGLMVRETLDSDAVRLIAQLVPFWNNGPDTHLQFVAREFIGGPGREPVARDVVGVPRVVRLAVERRGDTLSVEYSTDGGTTWIRPTTGLGGSITIPGLADNLLVGLDMVSNNISVTSTADFDDFVLRPPTP